MLLITVFETDKEVTVRTVPYTPSLLTFPTGGFMSPKELVMEKSFKRHVVQFLLQTFNHKLQDIHSVVIVHNNRVVCRWRANRGHFKEIT